jgi:hypothetical protein
MVLSQKFDYPFHKRSLARAPQGNIAHTYYSASRFITRQYPYLVEEF